MKNTKGNFFAKNIFGFHFFLIALHLTPFSFSSSYYVIRTKKKHLVTFAQSFMMKQSNLYECKEIKKLTFIYRFINCLNLYFIKFSPNSSLMIVVEIFLFLIPRRTKKSNRYI